MNLETAAYIGLGAGISLFGFFVAVVAVLQVYRQRKRVNDVVDAVDDPIDVEMEAKLVDSLMPRTDKVLKKCVKGKDNLKRMKTRRMRVSTPSDTEAMFERIHKHTSVSLGSYGEAATN